jgi:Skp family chaperone for outer membrane proteins
MRLVRTSIAAIAFAALTMFTAQAQGARPAAPQSTPAGSAPVQQPAAGGGSGKLVVIDSAAFTDDKEGITRVINAAKTLETEFQPERTELQRMQDQLTAMRNDIQKKKDVQKPEITAQQVDQADQLEVQIKRRLEDAQAKYARRRSVVLGPLQEDVFNALQSFAQARGIGMIIDVNALRDPNLANPILYVANGLDVTREFVAEYNRTHPATAAAAPAATPGRP